MSYNRELCNGCTNVCKLTLFKLRLIHCKLSEAYNMANYQAPDMSQMKQNMSDGATRMAGKVKY